MQFWLRPMPLHSSSPLLHPDLSYINSSIFIRDLDIMSHVCVVGFSSGEISLTDIEQNTETQLGSESLLSSGLTGT